MRRCSSLAILGLLALSVGCSSSTSVPTSVVSRSVSWIEELRGQVASNDFAGAMQTVSNIEAKGTVDASQMTEYLSLKAKSEMGAGNLDAARATLEELDRGGEDPVTVYFLRGELAMKSGNPTVAKAEFAKAKKLDPTVKIPSL